MLTKPVWKDTYVYAITEDEYKNRKMSGKADGNSVRRLKPM